MFRKKFLLAILFAAAATCLTSLDQKSAQADDDFFYLPIYKVEIQYVFFDTDYYHWRTAVTTSDYLEALGILFWLGVEDERGRFQDAAEQLQPGVYWRYIPVDYRLTFELQPIPIFFDNVPFWPGR